MDAADRERQPSTRGTAATPSERQPDVNETPETEETDTLAVLTADGDPLSESGYGFGV